MAHEFDLNLFTECVERHSLILCLKHFIDESLKVALLFGNLRLDGLDIGLGLLNLLNFLLNGLSSDVLENEHDLNIGLLHLLKESPHRCINHETSEIGQLAMTVHCLEGVDGLVRKGIYPANEVVADLNKGCAYPIFPDLHQVHLRRALSDDLVGGVLDLVELLKLLLVVIVDKDQVLLVR